MSDIEDPDARYNLADLTAARDRGFAEGIGVTVIAGLVILFALMAWRAAVEVARAFA